VNSQYLIPANTKKGRLIFGFFRPIDLAIFLIGIVVSFILVAILGADNTTLVLIILAPALICAFLVMPVPNYHNMLVILTEAWQFITTRQKFIWKGWCSLHGEDE